MSAYDTTKITIVEVLKDKNTGKFYFSFITHTDRGYNGLWQLSHEVSNETLEKFYEILEKSADLFTEKDYDNQFDYDD